VNDHWPLNTTLKENGRDGIQITPRWSTRVYYNVSWGPPVTMILEVGIFNAGQSVIWSIAMCSSCS